MGVKVAVVGGRNASNLTSRLFDDGNTTPVWSDDHYGNVYAVDTDSAGNVYTAGSASLDTSDYSINTVRKYAVDGTLQWKRYYHNSTLRGIAVNDSGDVVVCGNSSSGKSVLKFNASGTQQWSADHGATTRCVAVDSSGNVYIGGDVSSSVSIRKYDSSGTQQWTANHGATVYGIAVDSSGNVYICGTYNGGYSVRQYDSSGTLQWSRDYIGTFGTAYGIAVDSSQNVFICYKTNVGTLGVVTKYDSSGTQQWWATYGGGSDLNATPYGLSLDSSGTVWVVGTRQAGVGQLEEYNSSGTYQSEYTHGTTIWGVSAFQIAAATEVPALALALALGQPGAGRAYPIPALALPLALAVPIPTAAPSPPLGDGTVIYRCYLTGAALVELRLSAIECRRRRNDSTWMILSIPTTTTTQRAAIVAALGIGQLVVYAGLRAGDGSETMGEFLRATLTDYEESLDARSSAMRLTGRVAAILETLQSRTLEHVYERVNDGGRRSIKCRKVNPVLRPGDTAVDGVDSLVVHNITYQITPAECWMQVQEAP